MTQETPDAAHLSEISTRWSLIVAARGGELGDAAKARGELLVRYHRALWAYAVALLRSPIAAEEVLQDFALRVMRGDFGGADPARGRFRDLIKTSLIRQVIDFRRKQGRKTKEQNIQDETPEELDESEAPSFEADWRQSLIDCTWEALARESKSEAVPYFAVLQYRTEHPSQTSPQMADAVSTLLKLEKPLSEANFRKILQRARQRFADLLFEEVARSIGSAEYDAIEEELISLDLHRFCAPALAARSKSPPE